MVLWFCKNLDSTNCPLLLSPGFFAQSAVTCILCCQTDFFCGNPWTICELCSHSLILVGMAYLLLSMKRCSKAERTDHFWHAWLFVLRLKWAGWAYVMAAVKPQGSFGQGLGAQISTLSSVQLGPRPLPLQLKVRACRRGGSTTTEDMMPQHWHGSTERLDLAWEWAGWCHKLKGQHKNSNLNVAGSESRIQRACHHLIWNYISWRVQSV